jgi:uncharacterized protein
MTAAQSRKVHEFGWLVSNFAAHVPGVAHAVVVSVDGVLLTTSAGLSGARAEQVAAIAAGALSLTQGASRCLDGGRVCNTIVEMAGGVLLLMTIRDGSCLAVLAAPNCDVGQVVYEMTVLVDRVGSILTPELRVALNDTTQIIRAQSV